MANQIQMCLKTEFLVAFNKTYNCVKLMTSILCATVTSPVTLIYSVCVPVEYEASLYNLSLQLSACAN